MARWRAASGPARPILRPVLAAGLVASAAAAYHAADLLASVQLGRPLLPLDPPWDEVVAWLLFAARVLVPIGSCWACCGCAPRTGQRRD